MSGIVISFWEYCKLNFHKVLGGTVAECRWGKLDKPEHEEYVINGVRYIVTAKHIESETMTFLDKIKRFLGSDFAHLTPAEDINTINTECVCMTAGKED